MANLSLRARTYIILTLAVGLLVLGWNLSGLSSLNDPAVIFLAGLGALSLVLKVEGSTNRSYYDISFLIYSFTLLTKGVQAATVVILVSGLVAWAWYKYPWYIQSFNIAAYIFCMQAAGLVFESLAPGRSLYTLNGVLAALLAMGVFTLLNHLMVAIIVLFARGESFIESGIFNFFPLMIDYTLLSLGAGTALAWEVNPYAVVLTVIPLYLIYSTLKVPALERQTETDPKTGLYNSAYFSRSLEEELKRANRFNRPLTVVMADLDLLRNINNQYGHVAGDEVITGIARILKDSIREYDIAARFGGEEFALLFPETAPGEILPRIEAIRQTIARTRFSAPSSAEVHASASFGIAGREGGQESAELILHRADQALYSAKRGGRNCIFLSDEGEILRAEVPVKDAGPGGGGPAGPAEAPKGKDGQGGGETAGPGGEPGSPAEASAAPRALRPSETAQRPDPAQAGAGQPAAGRPGSLRMLIPPDWRVNLYIIGLAVLALGWFALSFQAMASQDVGGMAIFTMLIILTEALSIEVYVRDISVSTSAAPILASMLLFGPAGSLLSGLVLAAVTMIKHRSRFSRFAFNFSNQLLAGLACYWLVRAFVPVFTLAPHSTQLVLTVFTTGILYFATTGLIAIAIRLDKGQPVVATWKENFGWMAPTYLILGLVAYAFLYNYQNEGALGVLVILAPVYLVHLSQKQYIQRTEGVMNELKSMNLELKNYAHEVGSLSDGLLNTLAEMIDMRNPHVMNHSMQVSTYAVLIAQRMHLAQERVELIRQAGLLHDIGKQGIPEAILLKPAALTKEEYRVVKQHSQHGAEILKKSRVFKDVVPLVRHHHERFDGKGYPSGLKDYEIPLEARILALADSLESMASDRPYREALDLEQIKGELRRCSGTQFDPQLVDIMLEILDSQKPGLVINSAIVKPLEASRI